MMSRKVIIGALWLVTVTVLFFAGLFTAIPSADIDFSAMFFSGNGFPANDNVALQAIRETIWWLAIVLTLFSTLMLLVMAIRRPQTQRIGTRVWGFVCLTYILAPGVLANVILKDHWGRARPRSISDFGGSSEFTPALEIADQCARNCSFVSGEASGVIATALVLSLLIAPTLEQGSRMLFLIPTWGIAIFTAMLRVAMGGHFLSDVIFGALFTALIALGLFLLLRLDREPASVTPANTLRDLRDAILGPPKP